jgi:hypothetical protein
MVQRKRCPQPNADVPAALRLASIAQGSSHATLLVP